MTMVTNEPTYRPPKVTRLAFLVLALVGAAALVVGFIGEPQRTWAELLVVGNYLLGLGLGGLLIVALLYVTGARWSDSLRRIPEAMTAVLPLAAALILAVLLFCPGLYSWLAPHSIDRESPFQRSWLNRPFWIARAAIYLGLWIIFALAILRNSRRQDRTTDPAPTGSNVRLSALFLVVFGVTCWLASYDWVMSLDPRWASTIFAVYYFAGLFTSALAAMILLVIWLQRRSPLRAVMTENHLHDLGTLLFSFSSFWMYTWFCQYMLIWYVNNPEETAYLRERWQGSWPTYMFLALALNWGVPFLVLLFSSAKRSPRILGAVALIVLAGRWVDLFLMIFPSQDKAPFLPGLVEAGLVLGTIGVFAVAVTRALSTASLVPASEPLAVDVAHPALAS
jgi:hypothetical protein